MGSMYFCYMSLNLLGIVVIISWISLELRNKLGLYRYESLTSIDIMVYELFLPLLKATPFLAPFALAQMSHANDLLSMRIECASFRNVESHRVYMPI